MNLFKRKPSPAGTKGFLQRLARDVAGNTAAIMAAALLPLAGFTGAALDTARLYVVKVRLQQACDAGALAGRKMMTGTALDDTSKAAANTFFANNFRQGWFTTKAVSFAPSDTADGQVQGTASATVPATLMTMFGAGDTKLTVTCEARKEIGDVDVMFVLDTTGSMVCNTSQTTCTFTPVSYSTSAGTRYYMQEKSDSKIKALRTAVLTFYDTLAAAADPNSRIRYGFVPYSSAANVGKIIPSNYIVDSYVYPTRKWIGDADGTSNNSNYTKISQNDCNAKAVTRSQSGNTYPATRTTATWTEVKTGTNAPGTCATTTYNLIPKWSYGDWSLDVSSFKTGAEVTLPTKVDGSKSTWDGCILERNTTGSTSFSQASLPADLDINLAATSDSSKWRPAWIDVLYDRPNSASDDSTSDNWPSSSVARSRNSSAQMGSSQLYACPKEAQRLKQMSRDDVSNYVNASDFRAIGYTYHDAGFVWGARFLSPNGPFKNDTDCRPNRTCGRHLVFMTDGDMNPLQCVYSFQGFERQEGRVMGSKPVGTCTTTSSNTSSSGTPSTLESRHNARLAALCTQAKNNGITVWVVAYAQTLTQDMKDCASSSDTAIYAPTDQKLQDAFKQIAGKIAELRISK